MPLFFYKAVNRDGESVESEREAPDEMSLVRSLQGEGLIPIRVTPAGARPFAWLSLSRRRKRISQKQIVIFTRELLTLLQAGLPLDRALFVLEDLTREDVALNSMIGRVIELVKGGSQLSAALERQEGVFSRFYLNLIRAGEAGGALEDVLERLTDYLERSKELRDTVSTAMIYPAILLTMSVGSLLLLLTFVVPQFEEMFETAGKELPLPTQLVVGIAELLKNYWWALFGAVLVLVAWGRYELAEPSRRLVWDRRFLGWPLFGDLVRKVEVANFARTLATLLGNGVPLLGGLSIVKETLGNRAVAERVDIAMDNLKEGGALSGPLTDAGVFPTLALQMIKLGEESGHLTEMLERVAVTYDKEIKITVQRILALLEPVLIVGLGIMIGGIIVSILMAIVSVNDLAF
ncbi:MULTISPECIES: type II secretion system F family protein [Methylococcus]|uniref:Type II secretion system F family protein n=1 Tax=Methylococcus capsulatus TaxID=414 RepID=A0ABZ2F1H0_METCP|nr:type II secretion system F family protein [Methylococcus capsulatus]MDF9392821.1 type II secretion system F family protein [Methylococcus capsulatus]UQN13188.1 type II secretion system F family protein [Methylococcus capsulatus]